MKKLLSIILVIALAITTTQAQNRQRKMLLKHPRQHKMAQEQLKLSEDQRKKYKILHEDFRKNMMNLRKQDDITIKEWKTRMANLHKKYQADRRSLLTQEQKNRIEKMKAERKQMGEINARARMEKMKIQFGLNSAQFEKLNMQRKEMMEKMKSLHENKSMDMMKKREEIKALMEKRKETMKSILTDEQRKKIQEMKIHYPRKAGKLS